MAGNKTLKYRISEPGAVADLRDALGWDDDRLAAELGLSYSTVYRLMRSGRPDRRAQLALLGLLVEEGRRDLVDRFYSEQGVLL